MITEAFLRTHDKWGKYLTGLTPLPGSGRCLAGSRQTLKSTNASGMSDRAGNGRAGRGVPLPRLFSSGW